VTGKNLLLSNNVIAEQTINLNLADGVYLLVLSNEMQSLKQKFIIKK